MAAVLSPRFYLLIALALAAFVVVGFAPSYYLRILTAPPPLTTLIHVHAVVFTVWLGLFSRRWVWSPPIVSTCTSVCRAVRRRLPRARPAQVPSRASRLRSRRARNHRVVAAATHDRTQRMVFPDRRTRGAAGALDVRVIGSRIPPERLRREAEGADIGSEVPVLAVPKGHGEDEQDEKDCPDPAAGIPDLCWMCDDR